MKKRLIVLVFVGLFSCLISSCESTTKSAAVASGAYWATYSNIPGLPDSLKELNVEGPFYINRVSLGELSTQEELATVNFSKNETLASVTNKRDNSKYWVEQNEEGNTVSVKVSSNAANDFIVTLHFNLVKDDMPAYSAQVKSDDEVHSPEGSIIPDMYADPELPIAGAKELNFKGSYEEGNKIRDSLEKAGYETFSMWYQNKIYTVSTIKKLISRAEIEETVLKPKDWTCDKDKTKGNVGYYNKSDSFTGKVTINCTLSNIAPFAIEISDARLEKLEDGEDATSYTFSGTAEIKQKSFAIGELVYRLKDEQKKHFSDVYGFIVVKEPNPAVRWEYVENWEYIDDKYGTMFLLTVTYITGDRPTDSNSIPVKDLDEIDGSDTMSFIMPVYWSVS